MIIIVQCALCIVHSDIVFTYKEDIDYVGFNYFVLWKKVCHLHLDNTNHFSYQTSFSRGVIDYSSLLRLIRTEAKSVDKSVAYHKNVGNVFVDDVYECQTWSLLKKLSPFI